MGVELMELLAFPLIVEVINLTFFHIGMRSSTVTNQIQKSQYVCYRVE